jgi:hypothetical protein
MGRFAARDGLFRFDKLTFERIPREDGGPQNPQVAAV